MDSLQQYNMGYINAPLGANIEATGVQGRNGSDVEVYVTWIVQHGICYHG